MSESTPPPRVTGEEFVNQTPAEREEYLAAGGTPPRMSDEQVLSLPPAQRDDYFGALARRASMRANSSAGSAVSACGCRAPSAARR